MARREPRGKVDEDEDTADEDFDEDEGDEAADSEDDGDEDDGPGTVTVERLRDLDDWEMFRLFDEDEMVTVCTVAMRSNEKAHMVEYAIWREDEGKDGDEPGSTGTVGWAEGIADWEDAAREDALRQIVYRYEEDIGVGEERLAFRLVGPPPEWEDDDEEEGDDDGEEEEGDDDE